MKRRQSTHKGGVGVGEVSHSFCAPFSLGPSQGYLGTEEVLFTYCLLLLLLSQYCDQCRWMLIFREGEVAPTERRLYHQTPTVLGNCIPASTPTAVDFILIQTRHPLALDHIS